MNCFNHKLKVITKTPLISIKNSDINHLIIGGLHVFQSRLENFEYDKFISLYHSEITNFPKNTKITIVCDAEMTGKKELLIIEKLKNYYNDIDIHYLD